MYDELQKLEGHMIFNNIVGLHLTPEILPLWGPHPALGEAIRV